MWIVCSVCKRRFFLVIVLFFVACPGITYPPGFNQNTYQPVLAVQKRPGGRYFMSWNIVASTYVHQILSRISILLVPLPGGNAAHRIAELQWTETEPDIWTSTGEIDITIPMFYYAQASINVRVNNRSYDPYCQILKAR